MTIQVLVIGMGSGRPEHLTGEAVAALNAVDVFLVADKGSAKHDLVALRTELCAAVIGHDRYRVLEVPGPGAGGPPVTMRPGCATGTRPAPRRTRR